MDDVIGFSTVARAPKTFVQHVIAFRKMHALILAAASNAVVIWFFFLYFSSLSLSLLLHHHHHQLLLLMLFVFDIFRVCIYAER